MKTLGPKSIASFALSMMLLLVLTSISVAQEKRPTKLSPESANRALQDFESAERDLVGEKETEIGKINKAFEDGHKTLRVTLVEELNKRIKAETKNGNLDDAVEIRSAISFFETRKPDDPANEKNHPAKLGSRGANRTLASFKRKERNLIKKRNDKTRQAELSFEQAHKELRDEFVAELNRILAEQTAAGKLDTALEIRSAVSWLKNMKYDNVEIESVADSVLTNSIGMKLQLIPAGEFLMGCTTSSEELSKAFRWKGGGEFPQHKVTISKPFYMGTYEVTVGNFKAFVAATGYKTTAELSKQGGQGYDGREGMVNGKMFSWRNAGFQQGDDHPVLNVTMRDAEMFCKWLSHKENIKYQLPTEAQWEYACRAGSTSMFSNGNEVDSLAAIANIGDTSMMEKVSKKTRVTWSDACAFSNRVGQYLPNEFGLYDMTGNAAEMCQDWYQKDYFAESPTVDPQGPKEGERRVARGGGWFDDAYGSRVAYRFQNWPTQRSAQTGFRIVRVASE